MPPESLHVPQPVDEPSPGASPHQPSSSVHDRRNAELDALPTGRFHVAEARAAGVPERVTRRASLYRPSHGWRSRAPLTFEERCRHALEVAPSGSAVSHESAARLHGMWLPAEVDDEAPIHVVRPTDSRRVRRAEIVEHRGAERRLTDTIGGIRVTSGAETWADLAGRLGRSDLVAAGDSVARRTDLDRPAAPDVGPDSRMWSRPGPGLRSLIGVVARRPRDRHRRRLEAALALVRERSGSRMESIVRLHMLDAGLPEPMLNVPVFDHAHGWLGNVDFLWPRRRVVVEYQGRQFHTGVRRDEDEVRRQLIEDAGYDVTFVTASMVATAASRHALFGRLAPKVG